MKKATEKQIEIESEIAESEILIETEPQPEQPEQPAQEPEQPTEQQPEQPASETQKKKRGRPKKKSTDSQTGEKTISENAENEIFANEQEFENHKKQEQEQQQQQQQQQQQEQEQQKNKTIFNISGEMLLGAIDFTAPLFITYVGGFIEPKLKSVPASQFMLAEEERKTLLPAAEAVARENVRLSPLEMLLGGLLIVYTGKIYQAINDVRK